MFLGGTFACSHLSDQTKFIIDFKWSSHSLTSLMIPPTFLFLMYVMQLLSFNLFFSSCWFPPWQPGMKSPRGQTARRAAQTSRKRSVTWQWFSLMDSHSGALLIRLLCCSHANSIKQDSVHVCVRPTQYTHWPPGGCSCMCFAEDFVPPPLKLLLLSFYYYVCQFSF